MYVCLHQSVCTVCSCLLSMCMPMCVCMYADMCVYLSIYTCVCVRVCVSIYLSTCVCECLIHVYLYLHMCIYSFYHIEVI